MLLEVPSYTKRVVVPSMSFAFSIVVICKDAAATIGPMLKSISGLSDDIVVYDSGSTDDTLAIIHQHNLPVHQGPWLGFGPTRQKATELARYDWVLMVDADEVLSDGLRKELMQLSMPSPQTAYRFQLHHQIGSDALRWGEWRKDYRVRLYHKNILRWNGKLVHETIEVPADVKVCTFQHGAAHFPATSIEAFEQKMKQYAWLTAQQYHREGKRSSWIKRRVSPVFDFFVGYILHLGFLDGWPGYRLALIFKQYTAEKYKALNQMKS
jgi:glycosyltransferase involved in cell wall biosynthesis